MIGMSLLSFLVLLVIGAVVAAVLHYGLRYRFLDSVDAVFAKIALGWFGAWLGSPVFGHWWIRFENVYIVPAILGSLTLVMLNVVTWKAMYKVFAGRPTIEKGAPGIPKAA